MLIDCDSCTARPLACADCVVTVLLGTPASAPPDLDEAEQVAIGVLAGSGLVPPLRLQRAEVPPRRGAGAGSTARRTGGSRRAG